MTSWWTNIGDALFLGLGKKLQEWVGPY
jgi:hypothetical protein